jgi:ArsR family transcriptional regulator, arsenate/arsenite/antimonite-responsive transcriptional repressor
VYKSYNRKLPADWARRAKVFAALGEEHRQRILLMFEHGEEITVAQIADASPLSRTSVSHHLRVLREAKVLLADKRGSSVYLRPNPPVVVDAMAGVIDYIRKVLL